MILTVMYRSNSLMQAIRAVDILNIYRAMRKEPLSPSASKLMNLDDLPDWCKEAMGKHIIHIHRDSIQKGKITPFPEDGRNIDDSGYVVYEDGKVNLYSDESFHRKFTIERW